jgi:hypothetical protein
MKSLEKMKKFRIISVISSKNILKSIPISKKYSKNNIFEEKEEIKVSKEIETKIEKKEETKPNEKKEKKIDKKLCFLNPQQKVKYDVCVIGIFTLHY